MKFASVKFFKVLIITVTLLLIIIPLVFAFVFGIKYNNEKLRYKELSEVNSSLVEDYVDAVLDIARAEKEAGKKSSASQSTAEPEEGRGAALPGIDASFAYQEMYPHLYVDALPESWLEEEKVCYLTFDDGPSSNTSRILQVLEKHDIKATFFVTGQASLNNEEELRKLALAGHTIGVHSWSHDYETVYSSVEAFLEDFNKMYLRILEVSGVAPTVFRFPGGSINAYNQNVYMDIIAEMGRRGFVFYDWNVSAQDAVKPALSKSEVYNNVVGGAAGCDRAVVLMHDRADTSTTADALPDIIKALEKQGYVFKGISNNVKPVTYFYPK